MLKVGLTGSIAVGKSFVLQVLHESGCRVLDADKTAREVVEPGTKGLHQIVRAFGERVLQTSGELDRKLLAGIVFADDEKRKVLNSIVHPLVFEEQDKWLREQAEQDPNGIAVVDAALMIESGGYWRFDRIIVVWCESAIQLDRLMMRDSLSLREAEKRISSQMPQAQKKGFGDFLIDTSDGYDATRRRVTEIVGRLKLLIPDTT